MLYDKSTIHLLPWDKIREGDQIGPYLTAMVQEGASGYIANAVTEMMILTIDDLALPISINDAEYSNSYVCSPYTHYVTAACDELKSRGLKKMIKALGALLKWGSINRVVSVNNWLIPTNLYPEITSEQVKEITLFLKAKFPTHAIQFRSLNALLNCSLMQSLEKMAYKMVLSRQVYLMDTKDSRIFQANMFKKDLSLLNKCSYQFTPPETHASTLLYRAVYLDKYSSCNPQYTEKWVNLAAKSPCWTLQCMQEDNRIEGVYGYLKIESAMTMPFFGYDTSLPIQKGLYRIISTKVVLEAKKLGLFLHMSAGASSFKRLRRAAPLLEYQAVFYEHLPFKQKFPWKLLRSLLNVPGGYLLKKHG